jgi:hypothetical protein
MRRRVLGLVLAVALAAPLGAVAQSHGGGAAGGGAPGGAHGGGAPGGAHGGGAPGGAHGGGAPGGAHGGGAPGGAHSGSGTGAPARSAGPQAPARPIGGFNLDRDINAPVNRGGAPANRPIVPPNSGNSRPPIAHAPPANGNRGRTVVVNPVRRGQRAWEWNRGVSWAPAPAYWGGGFWGPFALGVAAAALGADAYGSFADPATNSIFPSYQVTPGSPGAALLENYQLTQTPCGPPGLVVIFGPDNSVICAAPNDLVGPGEYDLDSSNLTLVSQ